MAYTTINKGTTYFNTVLYTGTGSTNAITGVGFQPDFTWIKHRNGTSGHFMYDVVRGVTKRMRSDNSDQETTTANGLTTFGTDGFTVGSENGLNASGISLVAWNWKAGGTASANSNGTLATSVSANTTAGISFFTYTGTGSGGVTVGHGLGVKPKFFITKNRTDANENWQTWYDNTGDGTSNRRLLLNGVASDYNNNHITFGTDTITLPSSNDNGWSKSGSSYLGIAFAEKTGFSAIKEYTGNGSVDGTFIYLGFKPAWVMIKQATNDDRSWYIYDNKTSSYNGSNGYISPNDNAAEGTLEWLDFLSNGIKIRNTSVGANKSGQAYLVVAFAQAPAVGTNNVPCTAK